MTPIKVLGRLANRSRSPYLAESVDGLWGYRWDETPGTPWCVEYRPTGQLLFFASLRAARIATAAGDAMQQLVFDCEAVLRSRTSTTAEQTRAQQRLTVYREVMAQHGAAEAA
ncbi:hypothetical protein ABZ671_18660 [Micromonospora sp. NPDC006766]|uniref:hypothetical protein n=1 Tax=Micromonospora sp. NPDC006766 TaxID=3154778 RepID=UPI00340CC804